MNRVAQWMDQAFNSGDPEVRTWFLVRQTFLPFILCGSYAIFSLVIGPRIMKDRKPFNLRKPMIIFNFFVVATYVYCLSVFTFQISQLPWEQFCREAAVKKGEVTYSLATIGWIGYMLKYLEFLDTIFFVLRKKQNLITFLHVMHHTVVPIFGWILFRTETSGMQAFPVILNSIVHVVMYTYYGLAAMGPKVRKYLWWKKYLTQLQIIQFILIIVFVAIIAPLSGCNMAVSGYIIDIIGAAVFLYLFYKFYIQTFRPKEKCLEGNCETKRESSNEETIKYENGGKWKLVNVKEK